MPLIVEAKIFGRWELPHPWLDIFIPESKAEQYMQSVLAGLTFNDVPDFPNLIYGFRKSRLTRPLLRTPNEEVSFMFNILRTTEQAQISQAVSDNRQFYDEGHSLGGFLYPISAVPFSKHDWHNHFGRVYEPFMNAKTRYDRGNILTPGPGVFG